MADGTDLFISPYSRTSTRMTEKRIKNNIYPPKKERKLERRGEQTELQHLGSLENDLVVTDLGDQTKPRPKLMCGQEGEGGEEGA